MDNHVYRQPPRPEHRADLPLHLLISKRDLIEEFLRQKRIAIVGVSRNERHFSRILYREFRNRGYELFACNPRLSGVDDDPSYAGVRDITPAADAVIIMTPAGVTPDVVKECYLAGITRVWLYRGAGTGSVNEEAVRFCNAHEMRVISGYCPLMFLQNAGFVHNIHKFFTRLNRTYPE